MPPHHPQNIVSLFGQPIDEMPRNVQMIEPEQIARIMGEPVDLYEQLNERPLAGLLERIVQFFESDRGFGFACGFYSGAMFTVGAAFIWGLFLK